MSNASTAKVKSNAMIYKLTLDGGLLRQQVLLPAVTTLKEWEAEGKVELFEADRAKEVKVMGGWPGATKPAPAPSGNRARALTKRSEASGATFERLSSVLFPHRDPRRLTMTEINDVAHLLRHVALGHNVFVTANTRDFIAEGKRELLKAGFKILVMTPDEIVAMLEETAGLRPATPSKAKKR